MDYRLRKYILENRGKYTRSAIVGRLTRQGYDQTVIEDAWNQLEREFPIYDKTTGNSKRSISYPRFWLAFLGVFLGLPAVFILITIIFSETPLRGTVGPLFIVAALVGTIVGTSVTREKNFPLSQGIVTGLICLLLLPFVAVIIVLGICVTGQYRI